MGIIDPVQATQRIAEELNAFRVSGLPRTLVIAEGGSPPPPLSFMVSFPRLSLILSGLDEMEVEQNGLRMRISPKCGEAVYVPANAWNLPMWTHPVKVMHFLFGPKHIGISLVEHDGRVSEPNSVARASFPASEGALHEILNAMEQLPREPFVTQMGPLLVQALLLAMVGVLKKPSMVKITKGRQTYDKICLYLQEHFHQPVTRESVATFFRINPNHVSRLFRREGLMRFNDYLIWVRMDRAKYLLKHHDVKLDDLARSCGFQDTAYFCKVFKQRTNRSPGRYRIETRSK